MDDAELLRLFSERSERAIAETEQQYGSLCRKLAQSILDNREDAEECVNDALLQAWNSIPPESPSNFPEYLHNRQEV